MVGHRRYTRKEKAEAVAAATLMTAEAASDSTGIPKSTIRYWLDQPEFAELRTKSRDEVAERMWSVIQLGVDEIAKGIQGDAPLRDKATAVGILYDKHALLTGGATGRTESRDITGSLSDLEVALHIRAANDLVAGGSGGTTPPVEEPAES